MDKVKVAAVQMVSGADVGKNLALARELLTIAKKAGAAWAVLPEYWPLMGRTDRDKVVAKENFGSGIIQDFLRAAAQELNLTIFAGSLPLTSPDTDKVYNSLLTVNAAGEIICRYDKQYLFGLAGQGESYNEAATIVPGTALPGPLTIAGFSIAQGICYDLRFPEFFRRQLPFDVLILPAAFTYTTGRAHWLTLLTARAVENQCYVVAAAQGGWHDNGRRTFGHSIIIDPWGEVLATAAGGNSVISAELSLNKITAVRAYLPALASIRPD